MPSQNPNPFLVRTAPRPRRPGLPTSKFQPDAGSFGPLKPTAATKLKVPKPTVP